MEMLTNKEQATIEEVTTIFEKLKPENKNKLMMVGFGMMLVDQNDGRKSKSNV